MAAGTLAFLALLPLGLRTPGAAAPVALVEQESGSAPGALDQRLAALPRPARQLLSDTLEAWKTSTSASLREPRTLLGPARAPVRIVEFSDVLCSHCAQLHEQLERFRNRLPEGSFAIDSRQFPLDASCNPLVEHRAEPSVSCLAARVRICLEDQPEAAFALSGALFRNQRSLDPERVLELASSYRPRAELETCVRAAQTEARLREDIGWATELGVQGTPFVLVNGRHALNFPPLLEALVLAEGDPAHPAFASLPRPQPLPGS